MFFAWIVAKIHLLWQITTAGFSFQFSFSAVTSTAKTTTTTVVTTPDATTDPDDETTDPGTFTSEPSVIAMADDNAFIDDTGIICPIYIRNSATNTAWSHAAWAKTFKGLGAYLVTDKHT